MSNDGQSRVDTDTRWNRVCSLIHS